MASITIYPTSNGSIAHSVVGGSTAYGCLADNSDDTYIRYVATKNEEVKTSTFNVGASNSISGRFVITGITVVSRTKKGYNSMDTASAHSNLYVGGVEGSSWGLDLSTSWTNRSHTSSVSEFSNLNGKVLTSLPGMVLHLQSTTKVKSTGDNKWVGFSRSYITLSYDNYYTQAANGATGVSVSVSNSGTAISGYYKSGTTTTYTATLSSGYGFAGWYTASSGGSLVSSNLSYSETCNSDRTLYARAFAVSAQGETGVTASVTRDADGKTFTFSATLDSNKKYGFKGWYDNSSGTGTALSTSLSYTAQLSSATTLYAKVFEVSASGGTGVSASFSRGSDGRTFTFTATLSNDYAFDGWYNGNTKVDGSLSYSTTLSSDTTLTAAAFSVSYSGDSGISVSATRGSDGKTFTFTGTLTAVSSTTAYTFNKWTVNGSDQSESSLSLTKTISSNTAVVASTFTTTVSKDSGVSSVSISRASNTSVTVTAALNDDYAFDGWYSGNTIESRTLSYTKTIGSDTSFTAKTFHVSYSGDSGSSVSATRSSDCLSYTFTGTFIDTSNAKATINKWTVNNVDQTGTSLSLNVSISEDTSVSLYTFVSTLDSSSISGVSAKSISRTDNTTVQVTCSIENGWDFDGWYVSSNKVSSNQTYSFTPSSSSTYTPVVTHHTYSINIYGDAHSTVSVSADNYYLGTTVSISATIQDSEYKFKGWYNDSSYTSLYSNQSSLSFIIDGDKTLYAKTVEKNKFYVKRNGQWVLVTAVYRKVNGDWELVSEPSYTTLFDVNKKYIHHDVTETYRLITNDIKQFITSDNKIFNVNH